MALSKKAAFLLASIELNEPDAQGFRKLPQGFWYTELNELCGAGHLYFCPVRRKAQVLIPGGTGGAVLGSGPL